MEMFDMRKFYCPGRKEGEKGVEKTPSVCNANPPERGQDYPDGGTQETERDPIALFSPSLPPADL